MNIRTRNIKKESRLRSIILPYIENNIKELAICCILLIIGIIIGVFSINRTQENQKNETSNYINNFIENTKNGEIIKETTILSTSIQKNLLLTSLMWLAGLTIIGSIIIYLELLFLGFSLGYTVSSIMYALGLGNGIIFTFSTMLLQNIVFIPAIIIFAIYCLKQIKNFIKDRKKQDIKTFLIKHTILTILFFCILLLATVIETYVSKNLLLIFIKYL